MKNQSYKTLVSSDQRIKNFLTGVAFGLLVVGALAAVSFFTTGCSNQILTSKAQVDEATLMADYATISQNTDNGLVSIDALNQGGTTEMYFATDDQYTPPESVLAFDDMGLISGTWSGFSSTEAELNAAQVFFIDGLDANKADPRTFIVKLGVQDLATGSWTYFSAESGDGSYEINKDHFQVTMKVNQSAVTGSNAPSAYQEILLYSTDVSQKYQGELNDTAKFDVYDNISGDYLGQISPLHLYSN